MKLHPTPVALVFLALSAGPAHAQLGSLPKLPGSDATSLLGMPDVSSLIPGNAAGVLEYCIKNEILGGAEANDVLESITGKPEIAGSDDFAAGAAGTLLTGEEGDSSGTEGLSSMSIEDLPEPVRSRVCDVALDQAKSLI